MLIVHHRPGAERVLLTGRCFEGPTGCLQSRQPVVSRRVQVDRRRHFKAQALALALERPASLTHPKIHAKAEAVPKQQVPKVSELQWATNFEERYLLGKKLGTGSYGTCYIAIDRASGR